MAKNEPTKTELKLLKTALQNEYSDHQFTVNTGYRTHSKLRWGNRDFNAMIKLRDKGLIERVSKHSYTEQRYHCYGTDHYTEFTYKLTSEGLRMSKLFFPTVA